MQKETQIDDDDFSDVDAALYEGADEPDEETAPEPEAEVETPEAEEVVEAAETPIEEEAPKAEEEAPKEEPTATPEGMMPYGAYKSEKDKRQEIEGKYSSLEQENAQIKAQLTALQAAQPKPQAPDMYDDPQGFAQHQTQATQDMLYNSNIGMAKMMASSTLKSEEIAEAEAAFNAQVVDPAARKAGLSKMLSEGKNPYVEMVNWHKEQQAFAAFKAQQNQPQGQQPAPSAQSPTTQQPSIPAPPNISTMTPAQTGEGEESFDDVDAKLFG